MVKLLGADGVAAAGEIVRGCADAEPVPMGEGKRDITR
jgi:hypothetical protein